MHLEVSEIKNFQNRNIWYCDEIWQQVQSKKYMYHQEPNLNKIRVVTNYRMDTN